MDSGSDFYATVTWADPRGTEDEMYLTRYSVSWVNNWDYAKNLPYYGGWEGQLSLVREIQLKTVAGVVTLVSVPISSYAKVFNTTSSVNSTTITTDSATASLPEMAGGAYVIHAVVSKNDDDDGDEVRINIKGDGTFNTTIGYNFETSQAFFRRDHDGQRLIAYLRCQKEHTTLYAQV